MAPEQTRLLLVVLITSASWSSASHFRGAIITWKPGINMNEVVVDYRISWRKTFSSSFDCDTNTIQSQIEIGGEGSLKCFTECSETDMGLLYYKCTDYSDSEDWSSGLGTIQHAFSTTSLVHEFGFSGAAWIDDLNYGSGGDWYLWVKADLSVRNDTGKINSSPTAQIPPIVRLQHGCNHTITIPVHDSDGDVVKCVWASSRDNQCGSVCDGFPDSTLNSELCEITYAAIYETGWFAVAIQVEDYNNANSSIYMSSIPVQFLVNVYTSPNELCTKTTEFVYPTPPENACIGVPEGGSLQSAIVARVYSKERSVSEIKTLSPVGLTHTEIYNVSATDWRVNFTYTPPNNSDVTNVFCFIAKETSGLESERRCITLLAGVTAPSFVNGSQNPTERVHPSQRRWSIGVDSAFELAVRHTFVRLFSSDHQLLESIDASDESLFTVESNTLIFITTSTLRENVVHYFTFDFGVVKGIGKTHCGAESFAVDNPSFWSFRVRDVTPPKITWLTFRRKTNSTAELKWSFDEVANSTCTLTRPNGFTTTFTCNNTWAESGLEEGTYNLNIYATDVEGNAATNTSTWTVDTTPPVLTLTTKPAYISNEDPVVFKWTCQAPCTTTCTVSGSNKSSTADCYPSTSLSWVVPLKISNVTYRFTIEATDDVGNTVEIHHEWITDFEAPRVSFCSSGQNFTVNCTTSLNPETICNVTVTDNLDITPNLVYTDNPADFCGIIRTWKTQDVAGNVGIYNQSIRVFNDKRISILRVPGPMSIACGALDNMTSVITSLFKVEHPCNIGIHFSYVDDRLVDSCDVRFNRTWTIYDNCGNTEQFIQLLQIQQAKSPLSPKDGETAVNLNTYLQWESSSFNIKYEVYLWIRGFLRPENATQVSYNSHIKVESLQPATRYQWQIVYHFPNENTYYSPIWVFETVKFADLVVRQIIIPRSAFTGQTCQVKWTVENIGNITTETSYWTDAVYLSWDTAFNNAQQVAQVSHQGVLYVNDGYSVIATFTLEERKWGRAYITVHTDIWNQVAEYNKTNNRMTNTSSSVDVQRSPSPNLLASLIRLSDYTAFSGNTITVSWTIVNVGTGPTKYGNWHDLIWLSPNTSIEKDAKVLSRVEHVGNLAKNESYNGATTILIPEFISGNFYIIIQVDYFDVVFEGFDDNNTFPVERPVNVLLTQVPDLQVISIQTANLWKTGETVNIQWTVQNFGNRSPLSQQFWQDSVVMVSHTKKEIIGVTSHYGVLESDETYTASMNFYISPDISSGNFILTVWADYRDSLFEHDYNDNNELNKTITVIQSFPDLKVTEFSVLVVYENESTNVFVNWTTENIGIGNSLSNSWTDSVQVLYSAVNKFDALQHTIKTENSLRQFEIYKVLNNFTIPFTIYGDVRFRVQIDIFRTTGDKNNNNNIRESSKMSLRLRAVDFIVSESLSVTGNLQGGKNISIGYTVTNNGTRNVVNSTWRDRIFISNNINNNTAFYELNAISMISKDIMQQEKYISTASFILPKELSGFYFVHVDVNFLQDIFEGEIKNNMVTKTIFVVRAPVADLCVTSVVVSTVSSVGEEQLLLIEWWVKNIGNSMDSLNSWHDRVLFKHETHSSFTDFQQTFPIRNNLESQAPYRMKRQIALPSYMTGKINVCVETDVFRSVYEGNTRQNNLNCSNMSVSIKSLSPAKLLAKLDTISMNDGTEFLIPGSIAKVNFIVRNTGGLPTQASSWTDSIYIVNSNVYTVSDIKRFGYRVHDTLHIGVLSPNETYSVVSSFTLPKTFSDQSSIYVLANNTETKEESNVEIAFYHQKIQISNNLPNLLIQSNATIKNMQGGQPLTVVYQIKNTGHVTIDNELSWYDSTFLSEDFIIDAFDVKLMTVVRSMRIEAEEEVMVNITFILPLNLQTKTYVLVIICDSRDDLFEENENDNQLQFVFNIERRVSTDIVVSQVIVPLNAEIGGNMEIKWNVTNSGTSNAMGYKCDSVYLSQDKEWDIDDAQIGAPICTEFSIAGNSSDNHVYFLNSKTPDVASSSYNTIVKSRSNIDDVNLENNIAAADQQTTISYPLLALNTTLIRQLEGNDGVALRIINILADETLVVNITSDNEDAFNNVYIKAGNPATLYDFDKISVSPNEPHQIVSIPNTEKGDYYILVQNSGSLADDNQQNITVYAKYAEFEILNIFPSSLLPDSQTTMRFEGTLIPYDTTVSLTSRNGTSFEAVSTYIYSSTEAYATFILPKDVYVTQFSLVFASLSLNTSLVLPDTVSVNRGVQGFLVISTDAPRNLRAGETGVVKVNLQNAGDSDLLVPLILITAFGDGELRLIDETTPNQFSQNFVMFGSPKHGPAGILPPKTYTMIQFETRPTQEFPTSMNLTLSVLKVDKYTSNPFLEQKELFRPSHYDEMSWDIVWKRFISVIGNTTFTLVSKLSETLNEMSLAGRYVRNVDEIMQYLLKTADSSFADRILLRIIEFEIPSDLNVPMFLDRYLSTRIGSRSQTGPMGKGWILPLWDTAIKQYDEATSILTISMEKEDYEFIGRNDTFFIHENFGSVTKTTTEYRHRLFKGDKEYRFDVNNLRLIKIVSLVDESFLDLKYENNLLVQIQHSSGYFIDVAYDSHGRIQMMQLKGHSASRDTGPVLFTYDFDTGMLLEVRHQSTRTRYSYNKDYSLNNVENSDGSSIVFDYSASGEVISRQVIQDKRVVASREYTYSSSGQVSIHTQPENKTYNVTFDETGTVILIQRNGFLPDKTVMTSISEIQYDGEMVLTKRTLQDNQDTFVIEDGNEDGIGATFNDKGQLVAFEDGEGNQYQITLNLNGSLKFISFPDGTNKSYSYLQNGHSIMTQTGAIKRFEYNQDRKLAMKDIGNGSINTYSYDTFGRIQNILNENANIVVSNENDKITQFAYPDHSINYTYNENNQITSIFTSSGYVVKYEYNDNGHIHYVKDKENRILLTADYTESGQVSKKILGNNATTIYKYDPVTGLLLDMLNYFPNGSVSSYFKYKYSVRNRRISVETHEGVWKFGYDRAGQVVSMIDPKGTRTEYSYDKSKNRKIISINGIEQNTVVNELNQYIKYGNTNFAYDKNGNLIRRNGTDEEYYTFDEDNKLVSFKTGTYNCRLKYDGLDNLYSKHCNGTTTRYVVNPLGNFGSDLIIKVTTKEGIEIKEEFYHGGEYIGLIAVRKGNGVLNYFQFDPLGSVLGILNENGELLNQYFSDPFGKDIASAESDKSSFTFVGQWGVIRIEEISGVFYMRSRFYDSVTGRFLSVDSFGIKAHSKNFYVYCSNSPVHFNDPGGNCPWCVVGSALYGAAKNVLNYGMDTPYEDWTWGGAAGAAVTGGINGLVGGLGIGGKLKVAALAIAADVVGGYVQRKIDHQPNTWNEIKGDLVRSTVGQAKQIFENIPLVKEVRKLKCQLDINCQLDKILQPIKRTADLLYKASKIIEWIRSHDPNDILGPPGFGAARFISKNSVLQYKIRFENDANATAPAQRVYIKHKYSQHLDQRTFLIGDFGFGNLTKTIPVGSKSFQGYIDLTNEIGAFVKVFAGIDVVNGIAVWEFQTIDPTTGEAPTDPLIGFLPPNNGTSGQGFVTFSMKPNPNVNHLAAIHANASIFFDNNEPIDTPNIINTIDKQSPNMTASVINGTETTESITISFKTADSGSGVKQVDIFQLQEEQFVMLKTGITENIFVLPLKPNDSFTLVAIAIDEVGNRMEIDEVDHSLFLTISFQPIEVNCSCSGNGICSENSDVCICKQGFYGPACNSTARPLEPPVLEIKASSGYSNQPIPLTISARNLSGSREELHIVVSGIPQNTNFSQGQLSDDGYLTLKYTEFGALIMTTAQLGEITLIVEVNQRSNGFNFTRTENLNVMVYPRLYADIQVHGCFSENTNNEAVILLNSSISSNLSIMNSKNESSVIPHMVQMQVPPWIHPVGQFHDSGVYTLTDTVFNLILDLNGRLESVNISLTLTLKPDGAPTYTTRKDVAIKRFCSGDCDKFLYGLNCDKDCSCEEKNTVPPWCDRLTGSCTCAKEWIGDRCNETECKDGFYGISCEEKCSCKQNNTIECNRINGSCTCMPAWEGSDCETDVDECSNVTICDPQPHTVCQNKDWGYECLCMVGYELENNKCSASQPKDSTTLSPEEASVIRLTSVVIHLDVNITTHVNLKAASTYKTYEEKAQTMLTNYYKKHLGDSFIRVIIRSLVKGSLVIDHNVETKNTKNVTHALTAAVVQMADPKASPLVFDGQNVNVKDLLVNNIKVSGPDGLCTAFMSVENCPTSCELDLENKPTCRSLDTKKDNTILIIAVTVPVGSVVVIALVITIVLCRRKANKKTKANITNGENHRFRRNYLDTDF